MSNTKQERRINKIKRKYGADAFKRFGKKGGNELLIAQGEGYRITIDKSHRATKKIK
jgi:putative component of toxin-antitoxin plasmid stabilization module